MTWQDRRKALWVMFGKPEIQKRYGVDNKDDAEKEFKRRMGVEHLADVPMETVANTLNAMQEYLNNLEKSEQKEGKS